MWHKYGLPVLIVMFYDDYLCFAITLMINKRVHIVRNDMALNEHETITFYTLTLIKVHEQSFYYYCSFHRHSSLWASVINIIHTLR